MFMILLVVCSTALDRESNHKWNNAPPCDKVRYLVRWKPMQNLARNATSFMKFGG